MTRKILLSGHKPTFELYSFDADSHVLDKISDSSAPPSATWLERSPTVPNVLYTLSECDHKVYSMVVERNEVRVTSEREIGATWPAHLHITKDSSALITGGLGSGETIQFALETYGTISPLPSPLITYPDPYPYSETGIKAKFPHRQTGHHVHGLTSSRDGKTVYICDLGSDTVWIGERHENGMEVVGKMESEKGDTPRHCLLSADEKYLYVNSELQSELLIYSISTHKLLSRVDVTLPHLPSSAKQQLLTAELYIHPDHPRALYISNRGALRLKDDQGEKVNYGDKGDSITIVLLKEDGSGVQDMKWVETGLDWIRGMRVSDDGKWLACAGEYGGGLEIYEISGERGEVLNLKAKDDEVKDVNCVLWL